MSRTIGHGLRVLLWSKVDEDGTMIGTGAMPTAGEQNLVRFGRLWGANSVPIGGGEAQTFRPQGDDISLTTFRYGAEELANGQIGMRVRDLSFEAVAQSTKVSAKGNYTVGVQSPATLGNQDIAFIMISQAVGYPTQSAKWECNIIPICNVTPIPRGATYRADAEYNYSYSAKRAAVMPWGESINATDYGSNGATVIPTDGPHPIQVFFGIGDATRVAFNFVVDIVETVGVWVNGTLIDPADYTIATATPGSHTITFDTAPALNAKVHILTGVMEATLDYAS